jgi:hypothetical protein
VDDLTELRRIERAITHPDLDFEAYRVARTRFVPMMVDGRMTVMPVHRDPYRGSFITGTSSELIYSNTTVGTAKNTFTTEAVINDTVGMGPQPILPAFFWLPSGSVGKTIRVIARGIRSDVATTPTWQFFTKLGLAATTAGANIGSITATQISATAATALLWEYEMEAQLTVAGATGTNSTIRGLGFCTFQATPTTTLGLQIFGAGVSPGTVSTVDISVTNYVNFNAACGTSNGSNSVQLLQLLLFGLN